MDRSSRLARRNERNGKSDGSQVASAVVGSLELLDALGEGISGIVYRGRWVGVVFGNPWGCSL